MSKSKIHHHHVCKICRAQCCQYYALEIDTPRSYEDFDQIKWFLVHQKTKVFVDKRKWFLEVLNPCRYLTEDHHCEIYTHRPKICREYGISPEGEMDCNANNEIIKHDSYFNSIEELDEFVKKRFSRKKKKIK